MKELPVRIRAAGEDDSAFIYSTWLRSYAGQNKNIPKRVIWEYEDKNVRNILSRSITLVAVGDTPDSAGDIYSFVCAQRLPTGLVVHYAYTKVPFRTFGIARSLLDSFDYKPGELITHTYRPYITKELRKKGYNLLYVPYLRDPAVVEDWERFYEGAKHSFQR